MKVDRSLLKRSGSYTAHLAFRDDPKIKEEIVKIETENGWKRSELLRQCFRIGFEQFKKKYLKAS